MLSIFKRLAGVYPADTNEFELYAPQADTEAIVDVFICNQDITDQTYSLALTATAGAAGNSDWLAKNITLQANTAEVIRVQLKNPNTLRAQAGAANKLSFVVTGSEIS